LQVNNSIVNVLVVNDIGEVGLKKIASVSPHIQAVSSIRLWEAPETPAGQSQDCNAAEFQEMLARAEVVFGWRPPPNIVTRAPHLKWIQTFLAGVDSILDPDIVKSSVIVTNMSGIFRSQLTEIVFEKMLMLVKKAPEHFRLQQERKWERHSLDKLYGKTLGIIGLGNIGRQIACTGKAFGMRVIATRRSTKRISHTREVDVIYPQENLGNLLKESDFVVMVLPSTLETFKLIGEKELRQMKPTAYIINVGRGNTLIEEDLIRALEQKWIAGAGLDTYFKEPLPRDSKLWGFPNVIMTPHVAGLMDDLLEQVTEVFCRNLKLYTEGKKLDNVISKKNGY
jgi:phosphoglycerate dehydrogenase-like enzyme